MFKFCTGHEGPNLFSKISFMIGSTCKTLKLNIGTSHSGLAGFNNPKNDKLSPLWIVE